jgi:transcriptional regulator with XRE-family HTH domain
VDIKLAHFERAHFKDRLEKALSDAGVDARPTKFAREFNLRAGGLVVTVPGVRKWLLGDAFPTQEKLNILAKWLAVSPQWLRFGDDPVEDSPVVKHADVILRGEAVLLGDFRRLDEHSKAVVRDLISSLLAHHSLRK